MIHCYWAHSFFSPTPLFSFALLPTFGRARTYRNIASLFSWGDINLFLIHSPCYTYGPDILLASTSWVGAEHGNAENESTEAREVKGNCSGNTDRKWGDLNYNKVCPTPDQSSEGSEASDWVQIQALTPTSSLAMGELCKDSVFYFYHLWNGNNNDTYFMGS